MPEAPSEDSSFHPVSAPASDVSTDISVLPEISEAPVLLYVLPAHDSIMNEYPSLSDSPTANLLLPSEAMP